MVLIHKTHSRIRLLPLLSAAALLTAIPAGLHAQRLIARASADTARNFSGVETAAAAAPAPAPALSAPLQQQTTAPTPAPVEEVQTPGRSRIEISGYDNFVSNGFGQWRGGGLHLFLNPVERFGIIAEAVHEHRPQGSGQTYALTTRIQWSDWFTTYLGGSGGGHDDPNAFFPRARYDLTGILKTPLPGLLLTGGYTRLYYGRPVSGRIARAGAILYAGRFVFQGNVNHNNVRPGNRGSISGLFGGQYGQEGRYWIGAMAGGGKEAWQTLGAAPSDLEFDGYNLTFFTRKWFTTNFGAVATYNYNIRKTAYHYNGVELRLFWQF